jgi:hypothetical protein
MITTIYANQFPPEDREKFIEVFQDDYFRVGPDNLFLCGSMGLNVRHMLDNLFPPAFSQHFPTYSLADGWDQSLARKGFWFRTEPVSNFRLGLICALFCDQIFTWELFYDINLRSKEVSEGAIPSPQSLHLHGYQGIGLDPDGGSSNQCGLSVDGTEHSE